MPTALTRTAYVKRKGWRRRMWSRRSSHQKERSLWDSPTQNVPGRSPSAYRGHPLMVQAPPHPTQAQGRGKAPPCRHCESGRPGGPQIDGFLCKQRAKHSTRSRRRRRRSSKWGAAGGFTVDDGNGMAFISMSRRYYRAERRFFDCERRR